MSIEIHDKTVQATREAMRQEDARLEDLADTMSELAKRKPPDGSPVAGVYDSRLPPKSPPRKLKNKHGGNNRDSIKVEKTGSLVDGSVELIIRTWSNYGAYLELGTSKMVARPYFAPAYEEAAEEVMN